ncbi:YcbK family protein [Oryzifoliimicrobium ureilyticus]|uniref:YcbK family protein n=1 Tax=Oryzifoliimicrobium ureilyticus TaxID=3113724 RepID=UPI00307677D3
MRRFVAVAVTALLALSSTANAGEGKSFRAKLPTHTTSAAYSVQTVSVRTGCFSEELEGILVHIAAKTGRKPIVTSGYRPHASRAHSQHRHCAAADIRVPGVSEKTVIAAAKSAPGIGGIGRYCNGIIHVDTGPRRTWVDC